MTSDAMSVNKSAHRLADALCEDAAALRLNVSTGESAERLIDAGAKARGGVAAGLRIAEICMGGLADVGIEMNMGSPWPANVVVRSSQPVIACLASQYAGWSLSHGQGRDGFFALGSGPARALARKEKLFAELGYSDAYSSATLVLESGRPPPREVVAEVVDACGIEPADLTIIYAPTQSLAGGAQVVARVLEVALHKAHELKFPLENIVDGIGAAPLPPPHPDFVQAMGRTNDAIIFGGRVHLFVTGTAADARALCEAMPARTSRDYGKPFAETFREVKGDFYKIDPMLFSPADILVTAIESGETFRAGGVDVDLLNASFG